MRAQVKTLDGKTHTYAVQAGLTVAELKAMVSKDTGVAVNLQRIIFRGKVHLPHPALRASLRCPAPCPFLRSQPALPASQHNALLDPALLLGSVSHGACVCVCVCVHP